MLSLASLEELADVLRGWAKRALHPRQQPPKGALHPLREDRQEEAQAVARYLGERYQLLIAAVKTLPELRREAEYYLSIVESSHRLSGGLVAHLVDEWLVMRSPSLGASPWDVLPSHSLAVYAMPEAQPPPRLCAEIVPTLPGERPLPSPPLHAGGWSCPAAPALLAWRAGVLLMHQCTFLRPAIPGVLLHFVVWHPDLPLDIFPFSLVGAGGRRKRREMLSYPDRRVVYVDRDTDRRHVTAQLCLLAIREGWADQSSDIYAALVRYAEDAIGRGGGQARDAARQAVSHAVAHWVYPHAARALWTYLRRVGRALRAEEEAGALTIDTVPGGLEQHPDEGGGYRRKGWARGEVDRMLGPREVAARLGLSLRDVYYLARQGKLRPVCQEPLLFSEEEVRGFAEEHRQKVQVRLAAELVSARAGISRDAAWHRIKRAMGSGLPLEAAVAHVLGCPSERPS